ncbi:hypothetical protein AAVH_07852 [Aphelenchoides avenae]|nr:hypothetical protein AAVH_07852 [Aphelenchus avenae]
MAYLNGQAGSKSLPAWRMEHYAKIGMFMHKLRNTSSPGADLCLKLNDSSLLVVHSEVAGAHSDYFARLLCDHSMPCTLNIQHHPESVRRAIDYMYSGEIGRVQFSDLEHLLHLANEWSMPGFKRILEQALEQVSKDPHAVLACLNIATCHQTKMNHSTYEAILRNVVERLSVVLADPRLPQLSQGSVYALMSQGLKSHSAESKAYVLLHFLRGNPQLATDMFNTYIRQSEISDRKRVQLAALADGFNLPRLAEKLRQPRDPSATSAYLYERAGSSATSEDSVRLNKPACDGALDDVYRRNGMIALDGPLVAPLPQSSVHSLGTTSRSDSNPYLRLHARDREAAHRARSNNSVIEVNNVPNLLEDNGPDVFQTKSPKAVKGNKRELSTDSLRELSLIPDIGPAPGVRLLDGTSEKVFKNAAGGYSRPFSDDSVRELRQVPSLGTNNAYPQAANYAPQAFQPNASTASAASQSSYFRSPSRTSVGHSDNSAAPYLHCANRYVPSAASLAEIKNLPDVFTRGSTSTAASQNSQYLSSNTGSELGDPSKGSSSYFKSPAPTSSIRSGSSGPYYGYGNYYVPTAASREDRKCIDDALTFQSSMSTGRSGSQRSMNSGTSKSNPALPPK